MDFITTTAVGFQTDGRFSTDTYMRFENYNKSPVKLEFFRNTPETSGKFYTILPTSVLNC